MNLQLPKAELQILVNLIKEELICTAKQSFHEAALSGLCLDGVLEVTVSALQDKKILIDDVLKRIHDSNLSNSNSSNTGWI